MSPKYLGIFVLETSTFCRHLIARSPSVCSNTQRLTAAAAYFLSEKLYDELQWVELHVGNVLAIRIVNLSVQPLENSVSK